MFATVTLVTAPVNHGDSGIFHVRSLAGAICQLHGTRSGHTDRLSNTFTIPVGGDYGSARAGSAADSTTGAWPAASYAVTVVCTMPAPDNRTATSSPAITVVWP
jgi:hypothetical protein